MISRRRFLTLSAATAGAGMLGCADAFAIEPRFSLTVKEWTINHASWPASAAPLRVGVLTDIHAVDPWMPASRIGGIVDLMNEQKPDIIVLLGDYVNALPMRYCSGQVPVREWAAPLAALHAPLGVYAVLGNHDWWVGQVPAIRHAFEKAGIALLENSAIRVTRGGEPFWVAGIADQLTVHSRGVEDLKATLSHVTDSSPVILLIHEPDSFAFVPPNVTLTLAGHTHGGQVYIPFIGRPGLLMNYAGHYLEYAYGHIEQGGRHMIVSSGLGLSNIPIRFLVPPEIAMVTLQGPQERLTLNPTLMPKAQS